MEVEHPQKYKSRLGGISSIYHEICEKEFSICLETRDLRSKEEDNQKRSQLENQYLESGVKTIIFAALGIEAAINDYAAWQLGDSYFATHLSGLDVASKWVVIPRLVCGKSLDKVGPAFSVLKKVINTRNNLIHKKSVDFKSADPVLAEKDG